LLCLYFVFLTFLLYSPSLSQFYLAFHPFAPSLLCPLQSFLSVTSEWHWIPCVASLFPPLLHMVSVCVWGGKS
jgi:hypothetical protein